MLLCVVWLSGCRTKPSKPQGSASASIVNPLTSVSLPAPAAPGTVTEFSGELPVRVRGEVLANGAAEELAKLLSKVSESRRKGRLDDAAQLLVGAWPNAAGCPAIAQALGEVQLERNRPDEARRWALQASEAAAYRPIERRSALALFARAGGSVPGVGKLSASTALSWLVPEPYRASPGKEGVFDGVKTATELCTALLARLKDGHGPLGDLGLQGHGNLECVPSIEVQGAAPFERVRLLSLVAKGDGERQFALVARFSAEGALLSTPIAEQFRPKDAPQGNGLRLVPQVADFIAGGEPELTLQLRERRTSVDALAQVRVAVDTLSLVVVRYHEGELQRSARFVTAVDQTEEPLAHPQTPPVGHIARNKPPRPRTLTLRAQLSAPANGELLLRDSSDRAALTELRLAVFSSRPTPAP